MSASELNLRRRYIQLHISLQINIQLRLKFTKDDENLNGCGSYKLLVQRVICTKCSCADSEILVLLARVSVNPNPMPIRFGQMTLRTSELNCTHLVHYFEAQIH